MTNKNMIYTRHYKTKKNNQSTSRSTKSESKEKHDPRVPRASTARWGPKNLTPREISRSYISKVHSYRQNINHGKSNCVHGLFVDYYIILVFGGA